MNWQNQLKKEWRYNKEGIVGGAIVGEIVALYIQFSDLPLNFFEALKGFLFDRMITLAPQTQELWILHITSILVCVSIGYVLDKIIKPKI